MRREPGCSRRDYRRSPLMKTAQRRIKSDRLEEGQEEEEDQPVLRLRSTADAMRQLLYMQVRALWLQTCSGGGAAIVDIRGRYGGFRFLGGWHCLCSSLTFRW